MGAIASGGEPVLTEDLVRQLRITPEAIEEVVRMERLELERREREYRTGREPPVVRGRVVILVDDGLATGATMYAAALAVRGAAPARIVVAVPAASLEACALLRSAADDVVAVITPEPFYAVGAWYRDFAQISDDEVRATLAARPP
jgi:predicted phosphoribosyltransferase